MIMDHVSALCLYKSESRDLLFEKAQEKHCGYGFGDHDPSMYTSSMWAPPLLSLLAPAPGEY